MTSTTKLICWDLDETLGSFMRLAYEMITSETSIFLPPLGVRQGAVDLFRTLGASGYRHCVTTAATRDYAERAILAAGFAPYLTQTFCRHEITGVGGKIYGPVISSLGWTREDASHRMVVVGDLETDAPDDLSDVVFIHQPDGFHYDAASIEAILRLLEDANSTSFRKGFQVLYDSGMVVDRHGGRALHHKNLTLFLQVPVKRTETFGEVATPRVRVMNATHYRRPPLALREEA